MQLLLFRQGFNTQPPEGGWQIGNAPPQNWPGFQHTAARRRLVVNRGKIGLSVLFQHTAARRRLAHYHIHKTPLGVSFNTQPPEGGWLLIVLLVYLWNWFQHTAARRRLGHTIQDMHVWLKFQHTAARRRLGLIFQAAFCVWKVSTHSRPKAAG